MWCGHQGGRWLGWIGRLGLAYLYSTGLPRWLSGKERASQCRRHKRRGFYPWVKKIPWRRAWQPTPVSLPGKLPWTEEPGGLQSTGLQRAGHDWSNLACTYILCVKDNRIAQGSLLNAQCWPEREGNPRTRGYVYTRGRWTLLYSRDKHSIVKQLYSNLKTCQSCEVSLSEDNSLGDGLCKSSEELLWSGGKVSLSVILSEEHVQSRRHLSRRCY